MSRPSWWRKLEEFRRNPEPLGRAIDRALRYAEDLELVVQEFVDKDGECNPDGETTGLGRRALKLLDRGGKRDGDDDDDDGTGGGGGDPADG